MHGPWVGLVDEGNAHLTVLFVWRQTQSLRESAHYRTCHRVPQMSMLVVVEVGGVRERVMSRRSVSWGAERRRWVPCMEDGKD